MKKALIINASRDFYQRMAEEFTRAGIVSTKIRSRDCIFIVSDSIELFHRNTKIDLSDTGVFLRLRGHDSHFSSLLTKICLHRGIPINDRISAEHTRSNEKVSQTILLSLKNIPTPRAIICTSESFVKNKDVILNTISFPCVLKADGSRGQKVWKIKNEETLTSILFKYNELFVIQEYVPNTFDIRALVYNGEILGAIKRSSVDSFYNNVSKGGTVSDIELTEEERVLTIAACEACGVSFGGVDIIRSNDGPMILEVNHGPQIIGYEKHTEMNVPAEIAKRMSSSTKKFL